MPEARSLGRTVELQAGAGNTEIVYGPSGGKMALMNAQSTSGNTLIQAFVPLPGGGTAVYDASGTGNATVLHDYRHPDTLGSSRLASTAAGSESERVVHGRTWPSPSDRGQSYAMLIVAPHSIGFQAPSACGQRP